MKESTFYVVLSIVEWTIKLTACVVCFGFIMCMVVDCHNATSETEFFAVLGYYLVLNICIILLIGWITDAIECLDYDRFKEIFLSE